MAVRHKRSPREPSGLSGERRATAATAAIDRALPIDRARPIDRALVETWALRHLDRYASSAENLRRVLERRVKRRAGSDDEAVRTARDLLEELVARYRARGLLDDAAYAAGRAKSGLARGRSLRAISAGLAAKGVAAADAAAAMAALGEGGADPDLGAACAFARRRRLGPFRRDPGAAADSRRELAAFALAGFDRRTAEAVLACPDEAAVADLLGSRE
jgi:regulatory protein